MWPDFLSLFSPEWTFQNPDTYFYYAQCRFLGTHCNFLQINEKITQTLCTFWLAQCETRPSLVRERERLVWKQFPPPLEFSFLLISPVGREEEESHQLGRECFLLYYYFFCLWPLFCHFLSPHGAVSPAEHDTSGLVWRSSSSTGRMRESESIPASPCTKSLINYHYCCITN